MWKILIIHLKTRLRIFNCNVKTVLYFKESWRRNQLLNKCRQVFINTWWRTPYLADKLARQDLQPISVSKYRAVAGHRLHLTEEMEMDGHKLRRKQPKIEPLKATGEEKGQQNTWRRILDTELRRRLHGEEPKLRSKSEPRGVLWLNPYASHGVKKVKLVSN